MIFIVTLFYALFTLCVVYPPTEIAAAGFTIAQIFESALDSENVDFVNHHTSRVLLTVYIHSLLPVGHVFCLVVNQWNYKASIFGLIYTTAATASILVGTYFLLNWYKRRWEYHPINVNLRAYANNDDLQPIIKEINEEFQRVDKISIQMNGINKVYITNKWIIKTGCYTVEFAKQDDSTLVVKEVQTVNFSMEMRAPLGTQYVNIEVMSNTQKFKSFLIRVCASDFVEIKQKLGERIVNVPSTPLQTSISDQFVTVFKEYVEGNPVYHTQQPLSLCIGCMQTDANVILKKYCANTAEDENPCTPCNCRPHWCCECMARWFASRQDQTRTETWLNSTCTCPVCRARFCMLDVCFVNLENRTPA